MAVIQIEISESEVDEVLEILAASNTPLADTISDRTVVAAVETVDNAD